MQIPIKIGFRLVRIEYIRVFEKFTKNHKKWYACIRAANEITFAGKFPKSRKNREQTAARLSGLWWLGLQRLGLWRPYLAVPNPSSPQPISVPFSHLKMSRSQQLGTSTPFWRTRNTSRTMVRLPTSFPSKSAIPRSHRKCSRSVVETELDPL